MDTRLKRQRAADHRVADNRVADNRVADNRVADRRAAERESAALAALAPDQTDRLKLGTLDGHLGYFLRRLQVSVFKDFMRTLAPMDVRPAQYSVLLDEANPAGRRPRSARRSTSSARGLPGCYTCSRGVGGSSGAPRTVMAARTRST